MQIKIPAVIPQQVHMKTFCFSDPFKSSFFGGQLISVAVVVAGLISVAFLQQFRTDLFFLSQLPD
jgi:hypothetical protein